MTAILVIVSFVFWIIFYGWLIKMCVEEIKRVGIQNLERRDLFDYIIVIVGALFMTFCYIYSMKGLMYG